MSNIWKAALTAGACLVASTLTMNAGSAGSVTTTKDDCASAWAIIMASHPSVHGGFQHVEYKEAILGVVKWHPHWTVGPYERIRSQHFELQTFDTRFHEGGTAYVAHCGHGATCNELSREVLKAYPEIPTPVVYCTVEPPHILENPASF